MWSGAVKIARAAAAVPAKLQALRTFASNIAAGVTLRAATPIVFPPAGRAASGERVRRAGGLDTAASHLVYCARFRKAALDRAETVTLDPIQSRTYLSPLTRAQREQER